MKIESAIIVCGWHYHRHVYEYLSKVADAKIFIVMHRPGKFKNDNFECHDFPNWGFDWGAYKQGMNVITNSKLDFKFLFLLHDDLLFLSTNLFSMSRKMLSKYQVIGNGTSKNWLYEDDFKPSSRRGKSYHAKKLWIESYGEIKLKSPFRYVRGSFVGMRREVFEKVKNAPVKSGSKLNFGNWSLLAFASYVKYWFGDCIGYLGRENRKSSYLLELKRGRL